MFAVERERPLSCLDKWQPRADTSGSSERVGWSIVWAMNPAAGQVEQGGDRLDRFRELMSRLDPAGDPARAFSADLYLPSARAASSRIAARLALSPASTHLLVGGVGAGKTTELLEVQRRLGKLPDTRAFYIDVSKAHDIGSFVPGVVVVQVGLALAAALLSVDGNETGSRAEQELRILAHGYHTYGHEDGGDDGSYHVPGILVSPDQFAASVREARDSIAQILASLRTHWKHIVVLIDGLDRLTDISAFEQLVLHDVKALASDGIGVVLVGPLRSLYGIDRTVTQRFDEFHYQPWIDPTSDSESGAFLKGVLRKRLPEDALDEAGLEALTRQSGGVLRDLVALAQLACVEAYMGDSESIGAYQAGSAIDAFGRKHMQGLRTEEIEVLQRVRTKGTFVQTSEDDLALLMTRRVLEYRSNGRPRYVVHPTIEPFLGEMAGEST